MTGETGEPLTLVNDCPAPNPVQARRILALLDGSERKAAKPAPALASNSTAPDAAAS